MPSSTLKTSFDAVVMLTWSNWHTEPRSNRYHYATRFAKHIPVFFVQPSTTRDIIYFEKIEEHNIEIIHVSTEYNTNQAETLKNALHDRGVRAPIIWIYNVFFVDFIRIISSKIRIYHATEDYLSPPDKIHITEQDISKNVKDILKSVNLVVAVSDGVAESYRKNGDYNGDIITLRNGCDFDFWSASEASHYQAPPHGRPVAFFQGGVNARLDLSLLSELCDELADWDFWLCGSLAPQVSGMLEFLDKPNVHYRGMLDVDGVARLARHARVGLIPFKQDAHMRRSLPLKAYEYLACGLPVVTTPIDALASRPDLFHVATDARGFGQAIRALGQTRDLPALVEQRMTEAQNESYDLRFAQLLNTISTLQRRFERERPRLNVLMLYDDSSTHVHTIKEHLEAFANYSRHRFHFLPATGQVIGIDDSEHQLDFDAYDAIVIHYSVRLSLDDHLSPGIANLLANYAGPKLLFIQDEYERTETARKWITRLRIDSVFTNVPLNSLDKVYSRKRFSGVDFLPTLTGYVPEDPTLDRFITPVADREVMIGYRGRRLPHHYGDLGQEKYHIGVEMKRHAQAAGLTIDIEVDDHYRIYGTEWYRFMGSCRATLGTESGANVFDDDGSLQMLARKHANMPYADFAARHLVAREGLVRMNQISPKIFEAIRLRTALILFEGDYSGVVQPGRHYISLKKDFSNIADVFAKLQDDGYIAELTQCAYDEIIDKGGYSYSAFVNGIDRYLASRVPGGARVQIVSTPKLMRRQESESYRPITRVSPLLLDTVRVEQREPRKAIVDMVQTQPEPRLAPATTQPSNLPELAKPGPPLHFVAARYVWRMLPERVRHFVGSRLL
ncbi:MAG: glycosyltransferase [Rhizobiales bacterium]|nr:glycosyltransferase [Hyphomicrobiales bacterium]